jgi:hypothetical protein
MAVAEIEQQQDEPAARVSTRRMFQYSAYVDVGDGAERCAHSRDGECRDPEHFHAWCRLPNPYQHEDIRKKALAAKARAIRALRDPESDESIVLDEQGRDLDDPAFTETIIDELIQRDWARDYLDAQRDVQDEEEFEHIDQDREEMGRLAREQADGEPDPEFTRLSDHVDSYVNRIQARLLEIQAPRREELAARPLDALLAVLRNKRIDDVTDRAFVETYNAWMWFVGTFQVALHETLRRPHRPMWEDIGRRERPAVGSMFDAAPEVIDAMRRVFSDLQVALQRGSSGN